MRRREVFSLTTLLRRLINKKKLCRGLRKYDKIENLTTEVYDQQFNGSDVFAVNNQVIT